MERIDRGGSHIPVLLELFPSVTGPVLELGAGVHSTPLLSWLCADKGLPFVSYETDAVWAKRIQDATVPGITTHIDDYANAPIDKPWGMAFIDHAPAERRKVDILRLKDLAAFIVVHDTDPNEEWRYGFEDVFPQFRYRKDYTNHSPHTTVLSNL